jgi:hypothetical protein
VLQDLARAQAYEFAFIMQPLKLQGRDRLDCSADGNPLNAARPAPMQ